MAIHMYQLHNLVLRFLHHGKLVHVNNVKTEIMRLTINRLPFYFFTFSTGVGLAGGGGGGGVLDSANHSLILYKMGPIKF